MSIDLLMKSFLQLIGRDLNEQAKDEPAAEQVAQTQQAHHSFRKERLIRPL